MAPEPGLRSGLADAANECRLAGEDDANRPQAIERPLVDAAMAAKSSV